MNSSAASPAPGFSIRPLKAWSEYLAAEELQRIVWQMPDWRDVVPANLLITAHKNGGIVLGAFDAQERLVGFAFSFVGTDHSQGHPILKQCSHMLAVLSEYQAQKLGARLKFAQRQAALEQDISLITWTYDPLLALNANLNLVRLGAIARRYVPNAYGEMTDGLNTGLASDRFEVEWWLNSPRARACAEQEPPRRDWDAFVQAGAREVFEIKMDACDLPHIERERQVSRVDSLLVEIPADLRVLKSASTDLAQEWRMCTRRLFTRAFADGYIATDFVIATRGTHKRAAYLLTREPMDLGIGKTV